MNNRISRSLTVAAVCLFVVLGVASTTPVLADPQCGPNTGGPGCRAAEQPHGVAASVLAALAAFFGLNP